MIARTITELYLRHFNQLHGALCLCWQTAFCYTTKQLDIDKLKEQIRSHGIYNHENAIIIEGPFIVKEKPVFKTLTWVNYFTEEENNDIIFCEYVELYEQALKEVEDNLLVLNDKAKQITYANFILRDFDKSFHHIQKLNESEQKNKCKEFFEFVLNRQFISEDETTSAENNSKALPNYNLSIRLINHFDFIDRLIEMFSYSDIDLLELSKKYKHNLYIFDDNKSIEPIYSVFDSSLGTVYIKEERNKSNLQNSVLPKLNSPLSDDCLIKIMHYLANKKLLENPNIDCWLFWFNRKSLRIPEPLRWKGTSSMLSNVFQQICGASCATTIKTVFCTREYAKPTRKEYESGKTHKEIEQIITISKQKNN